MKIKLKEVNDEKTELRKGYYEELLAYKSANSVKLKMDNH